MGDPFDGLCRRVKESALSQTDKNALIVAACYLKQCAFAVVVRDSPILRERAIADAQKLLP